MEGTEIAMLPLSARIGTLALLSLTCVGLAAQDVAEIRSTPRSFSASVFSEVPVE